MKKAFTFLFSLAVTSVTLAQTYSSPESVEKNTPEGSYFIANNGAGEILKLMPDGSLANFATGIASGPHGLELIGDTLYACDGSSIRLFNRVTGAPIGTVNLGATFLNGITHKGHDLFITDFSAKKIYRMDTRTNAFNVFVNGLAKTPNGIIYDDINDRLVFVCWGSSAPVYEVNLADSTINLLTTTVVGNIDGIAMNCQGEFFISSWSPNAIRKYNSTFTTSSVVSTGVSSPADIYFDRQTDTLLVPNSGASNNVVKIYSASCVITGLPGATAKAVSAEVYPNPFTSLVTISHASGTGRIQVVNSVGVVVHSQQVSGTKTVLDMHHVRNGIYFLRLSLDNTVQTFKLCKQ